MQTIDPGLLSALRQVVGTGHLKHDADSLALYGIDRTTLARPAPCGVICPGSSEEVQAIVKLAMQHRLALVPSGGRTGLSGGAVAARGELVVSLERMNRLLEFNAEERSLTVEAGMITAQLQQHAISRGLFYGVDFASAGSSHIGGNIATNAGGIKVIRYGMTRDQILGLRVVDGRGELLDLNRGLIKNNTGPDLRHLFIGSEGILGIITEATIALRNPPGTLDVMLLAVRDFVSIMDVLRIFSSGITLSAFEFFGHNGLERVLQRHQRSSPLDSAAPFYVLLEFEHGCNGETERAMQLFERCVEAGWVLDGVLSQSLAQARQLWFLRESMSETLAAWKPYKNDIGLRISLLPTFIERAQALVQREYAGLEVVWYGHVGDGNLHLNVLQPDAASPVEFAAFCRRVTLEIAALVQDCGGSVSAEHGVGLLKKDILRFSRSAAEIDALRQIKKVFDPAGIMNPGKVFD
jgi:FAD/FMN-containing dehydrogenase